MHAYLLKNILMLKESALRLNYFSLEIGIFMKLGTKVRALCVIFGQNSSLLDFYSY